MSIQDILGFRFFAPEELQWKIPALMRDQHYSLVY